MIFFFRFLCCFCHRCSNLLHLILHRNLCGFAPSFGRTRCFFRRFCQNLIFFRLLDASRRHSVAAVNDKPGFCQGAPLLCLSGRWPFPSLRCRWCFILRHKQFLHLRGLFGNLCIKRYSFHMPVRPFPGAPLRLTPYCLSCNHPGR